MSRQRDRSVLRWAVLSFHAASAVLAFLTVPLFVLATGGWTPAARQAAIAGSLLGAGALVVCILAGDLLHARARRGTKRRRRGKGSVNLPRASG